MKSSKSNETRNRGLHWRLSALTGVLAVLAACTAGDEIVGAPAPGEPDRPDDNAPTAQRPEAFDVDVPQASFASGSCSADLAACGGDCVDLRFDATNCGSCGHSCGDRSCGDGICNLDAWANKIEGDYSVVTRDVARGPSGEIIVVGSYSGKLGELQSEGGVDAFVAKLSADGETQWVARFGGEGSETASAVAVDEEGRIAVVGQFDQDIAIGAKSLSSAGHDDVFVALLEADGGVEWARSFGDAHSIGADISGAVAAPEPQQATSVAFDQEGNVVLAGVYGGPMAFDGVELPSHGWQDSFVAKLSVQGQGLWAKPFMGPGNVAINDIAIDNDDAVVLVGRYSDVLSVDSLKLESVDGSDVLVAKIAADGGTLWVDSYGDDGDEEAVAVAIERISNHIILAGNGATGFFMRLEADGTLFQGSTLPSGSAHITDVDVTTGGNVWAVGYLNGQLDVGMGNMVSDGDDALVILLNGEMQPTWSHRYGDAASDRAQAVVVGDDHDVIIAGNFASTFDVGGPALVSQGLSNTFVAGLSL